MAERNTSTAQNQEYYEFRQYFISHKFPWKGIPDRGLFNRSRTAREAVYPELKSKFEQSPRNDALIQRLNGHGQEPPLLLSIVRDRCGCWEALQVLLESGELDIDALDRHSRPYDGRTALSHAAGRHDAATTRLLLDHDANPNSKDEQGLTPLMWMIRTRPAFRNNDNFYTQTEDSKMIQQFFAYAKGTDINCQDKAGRTVLSHAAECLVTKCYATRHHDAATIRLLLLEHNADPNSKDVNGRTPLMWMIETMQSSNNDFQIDTGMQDSIMIQEFFAYAKGMDINCQDNNGQTALILAAKYARYDLIKILIDEKADPSMTDVNGHAWFWWLLRSRRQLKPSEQKIDDDDPVFKLVEEVDLLAMNAGGRTLLSWAVEFQDMAIVKALLEKGADANKYDEDSSDLVLSIPFLRALESDNMDLAKLFSPTAWDPSTDPEKDKNALHTLAENIHSVDEERALRLLRKMHTLCYNMNKIGSGGKTPLHYVTEAGKERFALELLRWLQGKNIDVMDNQGKTPLFYALKNKMTNVAQQLVRNGANIDLSLEWFRLGAGYIRFTLGAGNREFEFMNYDLDEPNELLSAGNTVLCFFRKEGRYWPWLSLREGDCPYIYHDCSKTKNGLVGWTTSHITAFFPSKQNRDKRGDFWSIECGGTSDGKQFGLLTTIPSTITPKDWNHLCEQFMEQLLQSWESFCEDESREIEDIREKQLKKQGKSRIIIKRLAEKTLNRAKLRQHHQQHVSGLVKAFMSDANLGPSDKIEQLGKVDQLKESVGARLDQLEQLSKELLQIEFAWVSIREAGSIRRISLVTFIFLPLMFASSLFGMNVDVLANNPDWRWYVLIGAASLILTMVIWFVFGFLDDEYQVEESRRWAHAFWGDTSGTIKHRMDIRKWWPRRRQRTMVETPTRDTMFFKV